MPERTFPAGRRLLARRLLAELLGSALLAAVVIGAGIAAQQLSPHNPGLELFEVAAATGAGLFAIILMFGPVSGGHFNPAVSLLDATFGGLRWRDTLAYIPAQIAGCALGAVLANAMFAKAAVSIITTNNTNTRCHANRGRSTGFAAPVLPRERSSRETRTWPPPGQEDQRLVAAPYSGSNTRSSGQPCQMFQVESTAAAPGDASAPSARRDDWC